MDLFASIARRFREQAAFPDDAIFSLTDEQYVRNVLDIVCGPFAGGGGSVINYVVTRLDNSARTSSLEEGDSS